MHSLEITQALIFFMGSMVSLYGFGALISRLAFPQLGGYLGLNTLIGLILFIGFSGYVELFHLGSPQIFHIVIVLGVALAIFALFKTTSQSKDTFLWQANFCRLDGKKMVASLALGLFIIGYCINMLFHDFNRGDDYSSYLIFPLRILEEGFSGGDAFNLRGIEHGLGGGDYINALFLSVSNLKSLYLAESGIGFLLLGLLCADHTRMSMRGFWVSYLAFLAACITAIFAQYTNVTPILSGCAIGYGMLLIGQRLPPQFSPRLALLLGVLCGALIILKGNLLAPALMFLGVIFLARFTEKRKPWVLGEAAISIVSILVIMLPWMLSSRATHGTLFYPLLGKGFTYSGGFALVPAELFWSAAQEFVPLYSLTLAGWLIFWARSNDTWQIKFTSILCLALVPCTLILALTPAGMYRYCYVILATPCLYLLISNLCILDNSVSKKFFHFSIKNTRYLVYFTVFLSATLMLHQTKRVGHHFFHDSLYVRHIKLNPSDLSDIDMLSSNLASTTEHYSEMQNSMPPEKIILAQVEAPFLLDYSRNKIWVMDYPGSAGPRPPPYDGTDEELAAYFREHRIRYIMHSYQAWLTRRESEYYINFELKPVYEWNRVMAKREFLVNNQMLSLSRIYPVIYDDGRDRVIDLCQGKSQPSSLCK